MVKYIVHKANIKNDEGEKICHGEVTELSSKLARHYNKLGFLRPYLEEDEEEDEEDDEETPEPVRARV